MRQAERQTDRQADVIQAETGKRQTSREIGRREAGRDVDRQAE